jgi:hypothetical protein
VTIIDMYGLYYLEGVAVVIVVPSVLVCWDTGTAVANSAHLYSMMPRLMIRHILRCGRNGNLHGLLP